MYVEPTEISFFTEEISFILPFAEDQAQQWLSDIAASHDANIAILNYIFCSDEYLHRINVEYLDHDTYTDIITFDQREDAEEPIEGDIFISIDRVEENAASFGITLEQELKRVMAHGLLHLIGFGDKSEAEAATMRQQEDAAVALFPQA